MVKAVVKMIETIEECRMCWKRELRSAERDEGKGAQSEKGQRE